MNLNQGGLALNWASLIGGGLTFNLNNVGQRFLHSFGYVVWNNPAVLSFGNGGLLSVSLSNAVFGLPGSTAISATSCCRAA